MSWHRRSARAATRPRESSNRPSEGLPPTIPFPSPHRALYRPHPTSKACRSSVLTRVRPPAPPPGHGPPCAPDRDEWETRAGSEECSSAAPTARDRTFLRGLGPEPRNRLWGCWEAPRDDIVCEDGPIMASQPIPPHIIAGAKKRIRKVFGNIHEVVQM